MHIFEKKVSVKTQFDTISVSQINLRFETKHSDLRQNTQIWDKTFWDKNLRFETKISDLRQNTQIWDKNLRFETKISDLRQKS